MASRRKPQSLNDSHYRLLQDLTNPRPSKPSSSSADGNRPPSPPAFHLEVEEPLSSVSEDDRGSMVFGAEVEEPLSNVEDDRDLRDDQAIPQFSAITEFDSPLEEEITRKVNTEGKCIQKVSTQDLNDSDTSEAASFVSVTEKDKPAKIRIEGRRRLCKLSSRDSGEENIATEVNMEGQGLCEVSSRNYDDSETGEVPHEPEFIGVTEKDKPAKIKIEGRRRLCKLSSQDSTDADNRSSHKEPKLSDITDFDSPLPPKTCGEIGNDIRDILNDLTSRLELLSVEKKRVPKQNETTQDHSPVVKGQTVFEGNKNDVPEYVSAGSSFSIASENSFSECMDYGDSNVIDVSDDSVDDVLVDDKKDFILTGLKFNYKLPGKIAKMLYTHQVDGLKWLWSLHCKGKGGILGDDMGLGKTMQICGFLAGLFHSRLISRALVVAPKTLLSHWLKELSAVGLSEKTREYYGTCPKARQYELQYVLQDKGILLTTYDIVRNNSKSLRGDYYFKDELDEDSITWDYMILDEGHLIKNPSTQRAKSLLEIPAAHRIVVSGTPIQNNLRELWALFHFCCPELLGDNKVFKEKYENPILRGNEKKASEREKRIGSAVAKELRERIQPYFLRRLKNEVFREDDGEVAKLSKKSELIVWLRLTNCQRRLYEAFLNSEMVLSSFDNSPLAALTILKKICDHPLLLTKRAAEDVLEGMDSMVNPEDVGMAEKLAMHIADIGERDEFQETSDIISCKISFTMSLLDNLIPDGHNVLIFSQTRKMLDLIQDSLLSRGYEYLRIDGTTKASDRIKIVNDFQEGIGAPIFLLTSQVGGLGLTLTKADRVIVVDPAWNPSTDNQSVDRAYRIGQMKDVIVYRLMTCGTIEEKIYRKQIFKGGLFKTATEHKEQIRYFSERDLKEIFSLPIQGFDISPTQQQLYEEHDHQVKMDESLRNHTEFLKTLGIAGISHHSLLYSKTAPVQVVDEEMEVRWYFTKTKATAFVGNSSSGASLERNVDGAAYAFKPKDVPLNKKNHSPGSSGKQTESDIKERINRLSRMLLDKVTISRLPDKGAKIERQLAELNLDLEKIRKAERTEKEVINLDDISGDFQKFLNV
ncbi:protein CHROMATIN REMODELING 24 isoform X1 [Syzygium oleosum]|uniref:protein CHROMATIN REMODELING 24 isoform X1 n=1 Tax=Syzygium oleosum TaxID=219896 RepID=UPI0024B99F54|nr:protein CHROMATIN REMODELING 24 isoform X1 [Syzygium oleosum]